MSKKIIETNLLSIFLGLFGPHLAYHTNTYDNENDTFVISLIFIKFFIVLPWKNKRCYRFGFFTDSNEIVFMWKNNYKIYCMPWKKIIKKRELLGLIRTQHDCKELNLYTYDDMYKYVKVNNESFVDYGNYNDIDYSYWCTKIESCPRIFKYLNIFNKHSYEVYVRFEKSIQNYLGFSFNTNDLHNIKDQINYQISIKINNNHHDSAN